MRTVKSAASMQRMARDWRRQGIRVGFVPTMGYLHAGHISLIERARKAAGKAGTVVVSIYVNPAQFAAGEDLSKYPRDLRRDTQLCREAGVDVLFVPSDREMYPGVEGQKFSTFVRENDLSQPMEGVARPTHFQGVTTIVAKLFNIVQPDAAVFGQKDFQQAAVIQRMVRDLNFPVRVVVSPTVRENDGLAMSSRNKYLSESERADAVALSASMRKARQIIRQCKKPVSTRQLVPQLRRLIEGYPSAKVDYISFFDPVTLKEASHVWKGTQLALAVFIGRTRLIDNSSI